jgi:hypothetical protein
MIFPDYQAQLIGNPRVESMSLLPVLHCGGGMNTLAKRNTEKVAVDMQVKHRQSLCMQGFLRLAVSPTSLGSKLLTNLDRASHDVNCVY